MKFKSVTNKYSFEEDTLIKNYPEYLVRPISDWIEDVLRQNSVWKHDNDSLQYHEWLDENFVNDLNINFREHFPNNPRSFINYLFEDTDRVTDFLALCLQNYAKLKEANRLEKILSLGGSFWVVVPTIKEVQPYHSGVFDLEARVPEIIKGMAEELLTTNDLIKVAWSACYSKDPDYSKVVTKCVDALEGILRDKYFPNDNKPNLSKFIKDLSENQNKISHKGVSLLNNPDDVISLAREFQKVRGQHTSGDGRDATKEEAEFILHYTLFVFSLHL